MKLFLVALLVVPTVSAQFYVKDQQFRFPEGNAACSVKPNERSPHDHRFCSYEESESRDGHDFSINFVEFKANGDPFDTSQLADALRRITAAGSYAATHPKDGKVVRPLIFIYVHGWHNNTDERENPVSSECPNLKGDVAKFRDCGLALLARDYDARLPDDKERKLKAPPNVLGIYLGWQGTDFTPLTGPGYIIPSYMLRRSTADRVGNSGMCEAVGQILRTIGDNRERYIVALMGHSFGARVLENAMKSINPDPKDQCEKKARSQPAVVSLKLAAQQSAPPMALPPADLVFYVNAAAPNTFTAHTMKRWNKHCGKPGSATYTRNPVCAQNPFYVSVTSRTDVATRVVMPIANLAFFWWPVRLKPFRLELTLFSAANSFWMRNHSAAKDLRSKTCVQNGNNKCFEVPIASHGPNTYIENYDVEPHDPKDGPNRFWIMNIGHYFIANHGDVWNPKLFEMFRSFLPDYEATPTLDPPASVQAPSKVGTR